MGYTVLERNVRVGSLELDIVARHGEVLVIVEVRTRGKTAWSSATSSVTMTKQRRLRDATSVLWAARYSRHPDLERVRFDVATVDLDAAHGPTMEYYPAAFV